MRVLYALFGLIVLLSGCRPGEPAAGDPLDFLPSGTRALLQIHSTEKFRSEFQSNGLLETYQKRYPNAWFGTLDSLLTLEMGPRAQFAWVGESGRGHHWLLVFHEPEVRVADSLDVTPNPWKLPDSVSWKTEKSGPWRLVASSQTVLQEVLSETQTRPGGLDRALKTANPQAGATLLLPSDAPHPLSFLLLGTGVPPGNQAEEAWSAYDLQMGSEALLVQGLEMRPDSLSGNRKLLRGMPELPLEEITRVAPAASTALYSFSLQEPERFLNNQRELLARTNQWANLVESVEQVSLLEAYGEPILVLHCLNPDAVGEIFRPYRSELPEFQETPVYSLQQAGLLREAFEPLLNRLPAPGYFARLDELFVFARTLDALQNFISAYRREDTYAQGGLYTQLRPYLTSEATALGIAEDPRGSVFLSDSASVLGLPAGIAAALPEGYLYTAQLNSSEPYDLLEYQFRRKGDPTGSGTSVSLAFTQKLEGMLTAGPFFLKNHLNGHMDIAVQDDRNQLYLFSDRGALFWKKTLPGPIQGRIQQIDMFKNGRLQMAFTTPDRLMVLDRNGANVSPFPREFPGGNLNPLAVFDYEQNRNYRLVVTQGAKVFMFDGQGRNVSGFKFRDAGSPILGAPQHMRIGKRDYLLFRLENGQLKILNRVGDTRVRVAGTFDFSDNEIYLFRDTFTFTDRAGNLISVEPSGKISRSALKLNPDHGLYATSRTLALMNDNLLQVRGNQAELELGLYTAPRIFFLNDIIYVAVTDLQSKQLYLFRSDASALPGFPVEAEGLPDMADADGDRNPELAVRFRDSTLAVYRIQR